MPLENVQIQTDPREMKLLEWTLESYPNGYQKVVSRAVNKVTDRAFTEIQRSVRSQIDIKLSELKKRNLRKFRASYRKLSASIWVIGSRIPVSRFKHSQNKRGVKFRTSPRGKMTLVPGAFIATMQSGHRGVFKRIPNKQMKTRKGNLTKHSQAILELMGPSVPQVFRDLAKFAKQVHEQRLAGDLNRELEVQLGVLISQAKKKAS